MKRPGLTPHLVSATLFLVTGIEGALWGQEKMVAEGMRSKRSEELLKRYDKNGDGKLDDDERADAKEATMQEQIDRQMNRGTARPGGSERFRIQALEMFDKNRDGRLDDDEKDQARKFAEMLQPALGGLEEVTRRFDQNANGRINPEERTQIEAFLTELRQGSPTSGRIRSELLREFDRDNNGRIDPAEMSELEKFVRPRIEADATQLRVHDKNNDGKLDDAEWQIAKVTIGQWLNAPAPMAQTTRTAAEEQKRLDAVAGEVARRRMLREQATGAKSSSPKPDSASVSK